MNLFVDFSEFFQMTLHNICVTLMVLNVISVTMIIILYRYSSEIIALTNIKNRAEIIINQDIDLRINSNSEYSEKKANLDHLETTNGEKENATIKFKASEVNIQEKHFVLLQGNTGADPSVIHDYFTPRMEKVNPMKYKFLIEGNGVCQGDRAPLLLIMCLSVAKNVQQRKVIRETWGRTARNLPWPGKRNSHERVKIMFIFGTTNSPQDETILQSERYAHGDIVKADFVDSYRNLTRKVMTGIRWATIHCPGARFFMKVDDDTFVHAENAIMQLRHMEIPPEGIVIGHVDRHPRVQRENKWGLAFSDFPFEYYPQYASGQTYVISGNILSKLYMIGQYMPYIFIEDVFVTG